MNTVHNNKLAGWNTRIEWKIEGGKKLHEVMTGVPGLEPRSNFCVLFIVILSLAEVTYVLKPERQGLCPSSEYELREVRN